MLWVYFLGAGLNLLLDDGLWKVTGMGIPGVLVIFI